MSLYLVCPPGLEPAVAEEAEELLGVPVQPGQGGVDAPGDMVDAAGLCLWARTPSRVLLVLGEVRAASLQQLEQELRKLDWSPIVHPGQEVKVRVGGRGRIKHHGAAGDKVSHAINDALRGPQRGGNPRGGNPRGRGAPRGRGRPPGRGAPPQRGRGPALPPLELSLRLDERIARISLDAGGLLHKRGYRLASAKAPIRENLAASLLRMAGWRPGVPLVDPMCGAGTFSIEAGLWSADLPPSGQVPAVTQLPGFPAGAWEQMLQEAHQSQGDPLEAPIWTADRDPGACRVTQENASRAGLHIAPACKDIGEPFAAPPQGTGLVVLNPPYGKRVADNVKLAPLYRKIGSSLRAQFPGWRVAVVCPDKALAGRIAKMNELCRFSNGGINVGIYVGTL